MYNLGPNNSKQYIGWNRQGWLKVRDSKELDDFYFLKQFSQFVSQYEPKDCKNSCLWRFPERSCKFDLFFTLHLKLDVKTTENRQTKNFVTIVNIFMYIAVCFLWVFRMVLQAKLKKGQLFLLLFQHYGLSAGEKSQKAFCKWMLNPGLIER